MFCKHFSALFLWCHCYQIVLNPLLQLIAIGINLSNPNGGLTITGDSDSNNFQQQPYALYVAGTPITVAANKVTLTPGSEIALSCKISEIPTANFTWYMTRKYPIHSQDEEQQQQQKKRLEQTDDRYQISNNSIIIKSSVLADVGDYFCRVSGDLEGVAEDEKMISVRPKPYIHDFDLKDSTTRSAILEEGKSLKLSCNVVDDYFSPEQIKITWQMSKYDEKDMNDVTSNEDGIRIEVNNSTSQDLIIDRVTKDHRRLYKCQVTNGITENSKTILIRVKDKYTAIWPAVGIVLEIVILMCVIFVVENRKVEPDKGAYDRKAIQM